MVVDFLFGFTDKPVRTHYDAERKMTWFHGGDLCDILGYANSRNILPKHVVEDDMMKFDKPIVCGLKGETRLCSMTYINDSGVYSLVFRSTQPKAVAFKKWLLENTLSSIARAGRFKKPNA